MWSPPFPADDENLEKVPVSRVLPNPVRGDSVPKPGDHKGRPYQLGMARSLPPRKSGVRKMASIRKQILTKARPDDVWDALRDIGALHTRLVPGFVTDTSLEPGARIVTFGNGMVVRELIVAIEDGESRVVWSAEAKIG